MKEKRQIYTALIILLLLASGCVREGSSVSGPGLLDIHGNEVKHEAKIVVINVWATWCGTCIHEIPALNKLHEKYKNDPEVQFIAYSDEAMPVVRRALQRWPFDYPQVADARAYTRGLKSGLVKTYPQNLILNSEGKVVFEQTDGSYDIFTSLDEKIRELKGNRAS